MKLADQTLAYDVSDRHRTTTLTDGTTVVYLRDVTGRDLSLPGGVNVTLPAGTPATPGEASTWVFPNLHGDTILTTNAAGLRVGVRASYDPSDGGHPHL
ncbi:hypothetical protein [Salinibacterium sp.]|uniref:hypothetical protein n=1 Tax=Salinibacterium sp. TaxID=1915057 RepID=UPI00286C366C|nr:hypothetical protein [Salinibacterium sp.]